MYPTLQFLYSHHVQAQYITPEIHGLLRAFEGSDKFVESFNVATEQQAAVVTAEATGSTVDSTGASETELEVQVERNFIRAGPLYSLAALAPGIYVIGMKDQFNIHDLHTHPLAERVQYIADEMGFVLFDKADGCSAASVDRFGAYGIEQYLLMEVLSRQEVAANVLEYYVKHKAKLQRSLESYGETQGKGFICWRFLMKES